MNFNLARTKGTKALAFVGLISLVGCVGARSPLNPTQTAPVTGTGGKTVTTGGVRVNTGGTPALGGGMIAAGGSIVGGTGGRLGTGGALPVLGGAVVSSGGFVFGSGGQVPAAGGFVVVTGGLVARTGGTTPVLGGSIVATGGRNPGSGGTIVPPDAGGRTDLAAPDAQCGPVCDLYCPNGYRIDRITGCPLCLCNSGPDASVPVDTRLPPDTFTCPAIKCPAIECLYGYVFDAKGCQTCECVTGPVVCPPQVCKPCPYGNVKDANGCTTCECAPNPDTPCNQLLYSSGCNATNGRCLWLAPGCGSPALTMPGCFDQAKIDCTGTCPNDLTCLKRSVTTCLTGACSSCGVTRAICL